MVRMDSFSSVPPHIQPPMAQVPNAIRELTRFVPSMLMYSSIFAFLIFGSQSVPFHVLTQPLDAGSLKNQTTFTGGGTPLTESELFLLAQRTNVRHQSVNLILAERTLERGHSTLAVRNYLSELSIGQLLDYRRAKIRNVHALSNFRASSVRAVAHRTLRLECAFGGRAVLTHARVGIGHGKQ